MTTRSSARSHFHEQTYGEWLRSADTAELTSIERAELLDLLWWDVVNATEAARLDAYIDSIVELKRTRATFGSCAIAEGTAFRVLYRHKDTLFGIHSGVVFALQEDWVRTTKRA